MKEKSLLFSFNYRWYFSQKNFVSTWWSIFFSQAESNKRILALHWHFKNAKNINICLDHRCHHSSIWSFRTGIFQSKSIQQNFDFYHSPKTPFKKLLPVSRWNDCIHHWPCVSEVPRVPGRGAHCVVPPNAPCLEQHNTLSRAHLCPELKSSRSTEIKRLTLRIQRRCATSPAFYYSG